MTNASIRFRPMTLEDVEVISSWFNSFGDIALFDRNLPVPVNGEFVRESWKPSLEYADPPRALWYVAENEEGKPVGICGLQAINYIHGDAIVPVFVEESMRYKGLACAMGAMLNNLAFDQLRLNRVSTVYRDNNEATAKLVEKLGFKEEGRARQAWYANGEYHDIVYVGIMKSEWYEIRDSVMDRISKSDLNIVNKSIGFS